MTRREIRKGSLELAIMGLLARKDAHGYHLAQQLKGTEQATLSLGPGTLYPILHRLEAKGLVRGKWHKGTGRRKIKVYNITPKGMKDLKERRSYWSRLSTAVNQMIGVPA